MPIASAARAPTIAERTALTRALPKWIRDVPAECVHMQIRVSRNPSYAAVRPVWLHVSTGSRCNRYGGDGSFVFRKSARRWRLVFLGSDLPPCSLRIPRDLFDCLP